MRVLILKSMTIAAMVMVTGSAMAQNGHWTLEDYIFSGNTSGPYGSGYAWAWSLYMSYGFGTGYSGTSAETIGHSGSIKAKYKWNPGVGPNNLPPTRLYARVMPQIEARATSSGWTSFSASLDNGYEQKSQSGNAFTVYATKAGYASASVSGSEALIPSPAMSSSLSKSANDGFIYNYLQIGFAHLPPFKVTAPNHEDINYQLLNGASAPNLRDRDHEIAIDVAAAWNDSLSLWMGGGPTDVLQAGFGSFTSPNYTWNQLGDGTPSNLMAYDLSTGMPTVMLQMYFAKPKNVNTLNQVSTFHVFVNDATDSTSPTLNNRLIVRWHVPYENWREIGTPTQIWDYPELTIGNPGHALENGSVGSTWAYYKPHWAAINQAGVQLLGVASNMLNPPWAGLAGLLGVVVADMAPKSDTGSANFNDCWNDPLSSWPYGKTLPKSQYRMVPELRIGYDVKRMEADGYGAKGYTGIAKQPVAIYNGMMKWTGVFIPANIPGGGGGPGEPGGPGQPGGVPYGL